MKLLPLISAVLLFALPVKSEENGFNQDRLNGYSFGFIYGTGATLCNLAKQNLITKELANTVLEDTFKAVIDNADEEEVRYNAELGYKDIKEVEECKDIYQ